MPFSKSFFLQNGFFAVARLDRGSNCLPGFPSAHLVPSGIEAIVAARPASRLKTTPKLVVVNELACEVLEALRLEVFEM